MAFYFNRMPPIDEQKRQFKIEFGDSIDWLLVDFDCVFKFLIAAYNKVKIDAQEFTDFLKEQIVKDSSKRELLKQNSKEKKKLA